MVNDRDLYRIIRYFAILTYEHYQTQLFMAEKFNEPIPKELSQTEVLENVCRDFGLPFKAVMEYGQLNNWGEYKAQA